MSCTNDIIKYARELKTSLHTNNPYRIAEHFGIQVLHKPGTKDFTAHTIKLNGYPTIIAINEKLSNHAKTVLCAHELGHALLRGEGVNYFALTEKNIKTNVEYEANLFAFSLLSDDNINLELSTPMEKLSDYTLKTIIDYNLGDNQ